MDSPPKKRRRTSPRLADRSSDDHAAGHATASRPPDPPPAAPLSRSKAPSFASPTKASLARHNPKILERRSADRSAGNAAGGSESGTFADTAAHSMSDLDIAEAMSHARLDQSAEKSRVVLPHSNQLGSLLARPPVRSPSRSPSRSPTRRLGSALSGPARRTPVKPVPRPLPPPDPQRSEDVLQPLIALGERRSGLGLFRADDSVPEPELPPTPKHPDPEMSTPPSGIHNSTPSKRPNRRKSRGNKAQKGSPLKPAPNAPSSKASIFSKAKGGKAAAEAEQPAKRGRPRRSGSARGLQPLDPDAGKKADRDALLSEIASLEADLAIVAAENERIRQATLARRPTSSPPNRAQLLSVFRRRALPPGDEKSVPDATADWLEAALNPVAFLPFGKPNTNITELLTFPSTPEESDEPPVSHHPLPMTATEELPFLQAFSPLSFQSAIVMLPQETHDAPLLQKHLITATSITPPGLFIAHIEMTVHARSLRITELSVPRIDPAAAAELQPFVDRIALGSQKEIGSSLVRNTTVLAWGMGEWVRIAVRRAKFWCELDRLVRDKDALEDAIQAMRTRKKRRHGARRKHAFSPSEDDEDDELNDDAYKGQDATSFSNAELLTHLGRTAMDVDIPVPKGSASRGMGDSTLIRVQWRIDFDWTGEAQSHVGIFLGVPGEWRKADSRGNLARVPSLFEQLVHGSEDPTTAVQTIVALLAGENDLV